jgi:hypothetical protein
MATLIQTNFTAGELSPRLAARVDFDKYRNGCQVLENFLIHPHGGASRRPGLRFIAMVRDQGVRPRLASFQFSTAQAYVLEFGDKTLRFYMDGGQILDQEDAPYEIATPYGAADIAGLHFCQSADVMYLTHPAHAPRKLSRRGHTDWSMEAVAFTSPPAAWKEGNYPALVMFYEQRLCFAGAPDQPQTVWMSKSGSYHDFGVSEPLVDSDGCSFTLVSNQVNAIRWMVPAKRLLLGTSGAEWELGGAGSEAVTPFNVNAQRHTTHGSKELEPVAVGNIVLYVQRNGRRLREFAYSYESDGYVSGDMTLLAEHLTHVSQLAALAFQQDPDSVVWALTGDGKLLGLSYMRDQKVYAWHRHPVDGAVESLTVIPGQGQDELWLAVRRTVAGRAQRHVERMDPIFAGRSSVDAFFLDAGLTYEGRNDTRTRTLALEAAQGGDPEDPASWSAGAEVRLAAAGHEPFSEASVDQAYLLQDPALLPVSILDPAPVEPLLDPGQPGTKVRVLSVDSAAQARVRLLAAAPPALRGVPTPLWSRPVDQLSGLAHLAGATTHILADGAVEPPRAVGEDGALTLPREVSVVHVGLPYVSTLRTMNLEATLSDGTGQGRVKRVGRVVLRLYKTLGGSAGFGDEALDPLRFRVSADPMGSAPALFSGDYELAFPAGYDTFAHVLARQAQPLPMTVLALIADLDVTER